MTSLFPQKPAAIRDVDLAFPEFAQLVSDRFRALSENELYVTGELYPANPEESWQAYLAAFPPGSNPMFRVRTEHDCSACRQFIKTLGRVVSITDGVIGTVWDEAATAMRLPGYYRTVAAAMRDRVRTAPVVSVFRSQETHFGVESNRDRDRPEITWHHLHGVVAPRHRGNATERAQLNTNAQLLQRALDTLAPEYLSELIDLISEGGVYRGEEHLPALRSYRQLLEAHAFTGRGQLFAWENLNHPTARIRNTVIGTLLSDLSDGRPLDEAVLAFEAKVAPLNYRRPTALITPRMIDAAIGTIRSLGLEPSLERRHARLSDVSVNDVLWVDNTVISELRDPLRDLLQPTATPKQRASAAAQELRIDDLLAMQPRSLALRLNHHHTPNLVSLTAPVHGAALPLFQWDNGFAWSYAGEATDSIRSRVAKAGGDVNAKLRCSLSWSNLDDLDIHCISRYGHIYYASKQGILDVDMNVRDPVRDAVENLSWNALGDGDYRIIVDNYQRRETTDVGCTLEVEYDNQVFQFRYNKAVGRDIPMLMLTIDNGELVKVVPEPELGVGVGAPRLHWGLNFNEPVPVQTIMLSPNYWQGSSHTGNKHWFFILRGCENPDPVRGIYNEYLRGDLHQHRKVFEMLAARTRCPYSSDQLSGVGFSSTQRATVAALVDNRPYTIIF